MIPRAVAVPPADIVPFQDELPVPPAVRLDERRGHPVCEIVLRNKLVQLHRALGRVTPVWSYDLWDPKAKRWLADDSYLGPTLVVRRGQRVTVVYENALHGFLPVTAVQVDLAALPQPDAADPLAANAPGQADAKPVPGADQLYAWAVTHLHGARAAAMYDGWTENAMLPPRTEAEGGARRGKRAAPTKPGNTQASVYENEQRAALLWYHDHGMGVTRFNVMSGLAGAYLIRDPREEKSLARRGVHLPAGAFDVPLVIQDRNLDAAADGRLNGRLLHKSTSATAEFFGPYTLVNGVIWPKMSVERRRYRLRLLNGSNARTYCLKLVTLDGAGAATEVPFDRLVRQIGTDGGLLAAPVTLPAGAPVPVPPDGQPVPTTDGLILGSAERADLYVDFGKLGDDVKSVALVNTAFAPFHRFTVQHPDPNPDPTQVETDPTTGQPVPPAAAGTAVPGMRLPHPWVMRFDLGARPDDDPATDLITPPEGQDLKLVADPGPASHDDLPGVPDPHGHRLVALVEFPPGMLMSYELAETTVTEAGRFTPLAEGGLITVQDKDAQGNPVFRTYAPGPQGQFTPVGAGGPIAIRDADGQGNPVTKTYVPVATRFEDRVAFFAPYGRWENWKVLNLTVDTHPFHIHLVQFRLLERRLFDVTGFDPAAGATPPDRPVAYRGALGPVDDNEKGWKDTVRVNPGEMVSLALRCDGFTGRYMYHCHILEHEDHDMMRLFVATPGPVMKLMMDAPMLDGMSGMGGMTGMAASRAAAAPRRRPAARRGKAVPLEAAEPALRMSDAVFRSVVEVPVVWDGAAGGAPAGTQLLAASLEADVAEAETASLEADGAGAGTASQTYTVFIVNRSNWTVIGKQVGDTGTPERVIPPVGRTCTASCEECKQNGPRVPLHEVSCSADPFSLYVLFERNGQFARLNPPLPVSPTCDERGVVFCLEPPD
jgi:spore coat protein A